MCCYSISVPVYRKHYLKIFSHSVVKLSLSKHIEHICQCSWLYECFIAISYQTIQLAVWPLPKQLPVCKGLTLQLQIQITTCVIRVRYKHCPYHLNIYSTIQHLYFVIPVPSKIALDRRGSNKFNVYNINVNEIILMVLH